MPLKNLKCKDDTIVRPFHLFNTAMNIAQGKNLAWQERRGRFVRPDAAARGIPAFQCAGRLHRPDGRQGNSLWFPSDR